MVNALKYLVLIAIIGCCTYNTNAQDKRLVLGMRGGLNISSAIVDEDCDNKFRAKFHIGMTADYALSSHFAIQSGLFFSKKGSKLLLWGDSNNIRRTTYFENNADAYIFNQSYLELPVYGAYKIGLNRSLTMVVGLGPYVAYGIGGKTKYREKEWDTFGDGVIDDDQYWLHKEILRKFDFGAGMKVDLEYQRYIAGASFSLSIANHAKKKQYIDWEYRNVNFAFSVGYKLY